METYARWCLLKASIGLYLNGLNHVELNLIVVVWCQRAPVLLLSRIQRLPNMTEAFPLANFSIPPCDPLLERFLKQLYQCVIKIGYLTIYYEKIHDMEYKNMYITYCLHGRHNKDWPDNQRPDPIPALMLMESHCLFVVWSHLLFPNCNIKNGLIEFYSHIRTSYITHYYSILYFLTKH